MYWSQQEVCLTCIEIFNKGSQRNHLQVVIFFFFSFPVILMEHFPGKGKQVLLQIEYFPQPLHMQNNIFLHIYAFLNLKLGSLQSPYKLHETGLLANCSRVFKLSLHPFLCPHKGFMEKSFPTTDVELQVFDASLLDLGQCTRSCQLQKVEENTWRN